MMKEWNMYEHDAVRHGLLNSRKDWIINNLPQFLTKDQFKEDNGFLIRVQKRLEDIMRKEEIEVVRKNLIEKNKYVKIINTGAKNARRGRKCSKQRYRFFNQTPIYQTGRNVATLAKPGKRSRLL